MTPYLFKGAKMIDALKKTWKAAGSVGGLVGDGVDVVTEGVGIFKEKVTSSREEVKIEEAKNQVLALANAIREIKEALNCSAAEAEEILNKQLAKKK